MTGRLPFYRFSIKGIRRNATVLWALQNILPDYLCRGCRLWMSMMPTMDVFLATYSHLILHLHIHNKRNIISYVLALRNQRFNKAHWPTFAFWEFMCSNLYIRQYGINIWTAISSFSWEHAQHFLNLRLNQQKYWATKYQTPFFVTCFAKWSRTLSVVSSGAVPK